jgi:hypothetical protein
MSFKIKKHWLYIVDTLVLGIALTLVIASIYGSTKDTKSTNCEPRGKEHSLTLHADDFSKNKLTMQKCDSVKITNYDNLDYRLAFGVHDRHVTYPGFQEQILRPTKSLRFEAVKAGTYLMHDHLRDQATIQFTITSN